MLKKKECPFTNILLSNSQTSIIIQTILSDVETNSEKAKVLISDYISEKDFTTKSVLEHRMRTCSCGLRGRKAEDIAVRGPVLSNQNPIRSEKFVAPKGWEPGILFAKDGRTPTEITTPPGLQANTNEELENRIVEMGAMIPEGYTFIMTKASYNPNAWTRTPERQGDNESKVPALTKPSWSYKFNVVPIATLLEEQENRMEQDLIDMIIKHKPIKTLISNGLGQAFVVNYADLQIGKIDDEGGSDETVARFLKLTDEAVLRLKNLRKTGVIIDEIVISWMGDCIEGLSSQNGRLAFRQDLAPTQQIRLLRRLMVHAIKIFAPLSSKILVITIPGNHDDSQRIVVTNHDDDFATEAASSVADQLSENPEAFGHIRFMYPQHDRTTVTADICGTIIGFAHGHQTKGKAFTWWANMAHGMQPIGEATILVTAHFHHFLSQRPGLKWWLQCPALDNGSRWWTEKTGARSKAGLLTFTAGNGEIENIEVLWDKLTKSDFPTLGKERN